MDGWSHRLQYLSLGGYGGLGLGSLLLVQVEDPTVPEIKQKRECLGGRGVTTETIGCDLSTARVEIKEV